MSVSPLDEIPLRVAEILGRQPESIVIRFPGRTFIRIAPDSAPAAKTTNPEVAKRYETWRNRIIPYLQKVGIPLKRVQIAAGLELKGKMRTKGWFGRTIRMLIKTGELVESERRYLSLKRPNTTGDTKTETVKKRKET